MLYPLLKRMEKDGLIRSRWKLTDRTRLRKYYHLTDKGIKEQEKEQAHWMMVNGVFSKLLETVLPSEG